LNKNENTPAPGFPLKLLRWFCKPEYLPDIEGDLLQLYYRRAESVGHRRANLLLLRDVLLLCRPGLIRSSDLLRRNKPTTSMLRHNITVSFRNFARHKTTFVINVIGLSSGLMCVLLIGLWVESERSVDQFHKQGSRIYQIMNNLYAQDTLTFDMTPAPLASALVAEFPEVERAVATNNFFSWETRDGILSAGTISIQGTGWHAGSDFFKVFSFPLVQGNEDRVLTDKNSIVISEDVARKLFPGGGSAIGKSISWKHPLFEGTFLVSGVFETLPAASSAKFDFLISMEVLLEHDRWAPKWTGNYAQTFVLLKEGADVAQFDKKLKGFLKSKEPGLDKFSLFTQLYGSRYLHGNFVNGAPSGGRIENVRLFSVLGLFILLVACVNFINLSTAEGSLRMKEIGVKKTMGASQWLMVQRFFVESLVMTLISAVVAVILVVLVTPRLNDFLDRDLLLKVEPVHIIGFGGIVLLTAIVAGAYPAIHLSRFKPVSVLKGRLAESRGQWTFRRSLVVFQFALVVIFLVAIQVIHRQIEFTQTKDLGYNRYNIISFPWKGELYNNWNGLGEGGKNNQNFELFMSRLRELPSVHHATNMLGNILDKIPGQSGITWSGLESERAYEFQSPVVGFDFVETMGIEMIAGRTFSKERHDDYSKIILNESAVKLMGLRDPVGKTIDMNGGSEIVGVVRDFHYGSLHEPIRPLILRCDPTGRTVTVKIRAGQQRQAIDDIAKVYSTFLPGYTFDATFMDDDYLALYASETSMASLSKYLSVVAIVISCLGLFGLAAFAADRRMKEISIRKVFGSTSADVVRVLSREFTRPVLVSIAVGIPISFFLAQEWLSGFAERIELAWWYFALAAIVALVVSWLAVALKTLKAARASVLRGLREE
jgi:ABC-type antimicrobial peptide transport system permease subunit